MPQHLFLILLPLLDHQARDTAKTTYAYQVQYQHIAQTYANQRRDPQHRRVLILNHIVLAPLHLFRVDKARAINAPACLEQEDAAAIEQFHFDLVEGWVSRLDPETDDGS